MIGDENKIVFTAILTEWVRLYISPVSRFSRFIFYLDNTSSVTHILALASRDLVSAGLYNLFGD